MLLGGIRTNQNQSEPIRRCPNLPVDTGTQALVRLPIIQRQKDKSQKLNTAAFISGYRGSPLGMYDKSLWTAKKFLKNNDINFESGLNEDLAATAVWGSQQSGLISKSTKDGVFGILY